MLKTFKAGVHPKEYKDLTEDMALEKMPLPSKVVIALNQHLGKPAVPVVKKGDEVKEGDLLAKADGFISAPIHSPISGKVKQITKAPHILGMAVDSIVIDRDEAVPEKVWKRNSNTISGLSKEKFIGIVKDKGVVGLGGAGFPTFVKFMTKENQTIEKVLINACECEPYLNVDNRAMLEQTTEFIDGLKLIKDVCDIDEIVIGVENNKTEANQLLRKKLAHIVDIRVESLQTKYPQGGEKMLIKAAINREVPVGGLPLDVGVVVLNVNTVIAIYNAVYFDKPILEKAITVSGLGINSPKNVIAKLGTVHQEILDYCGGLNEKVERLVVGGPMMGFAQPDAAASVVKTTTGLLALTKDEIGKEKIEACIKCSKCVYNCPMGLVPTDIAKYVEFDRLDLAEKADIMSCIECGSCVYGCPASGRPMVQWFKLGKEKLRSNK